LPYLGDKPRYSRVQFLTFEKSFFVGELNSLDNPNALSIIHWPIMHRVISCAVSSISTVPSQVSVNDSVFTLYFS
jgi:hypothetical protein